MFPLWNTTSTPLLQTETQLPNDVFTGSHLFNLYHCVCFKGGVCAYCNIKPSVALQVDLISPNVDSIWLKIYPLVSTIYLYLIYHSNFDNFFSFFDCFTWKEMWAVLSPLCWGTSVHHKECLNSPHNDTRGNEACSFLVPKDLKQLSRHPTHVPTHHNQTYNSFLFTCNSLCCCSSFIPFRILFLQSVTTVLTPPPPIALPKYQLWSSVN